MPTIDPNEIYTTKEACGFLKISESTIKRMLKKGIIKAYKVGDRYRIWGRDLLMLLSPKTEKQVAGVYRKIKDKTKKKIQNW